MFQQRSLPFLLSFLITLGDVATPSAYSSEAITVWGENSYGQTEPPAALSNIISLAGGDYHCLALRADGTVVAWGANYAGQTNVPADLTNAVSIAAGSSHSLALRSDGTIAMWGRMISGVKTVSPEATNVVALALGPGAWHALALRADGRLVDWGYEQYGLTNVPPTAANSVAIAVGAFHSLALRADGRVVAWGDDTWGQTNVPADATNIVAISAGWYHSVGLRADGTIVIWGSTAYYGGSLALPRLPPAQVIDVASGGNHVLVLERDGTVVAWGNDNLGQTTVPSAAWPAAAIAGGSYDSLALAATGPPIFSTPAVGRSVVRGETAYFRMFAVGAPPLAYQWSCNGTNLAGATNSVLVVPNVQPWQTGSSYTVSARNAFGAVTSAPITLRVESSEVTIHPSIQTVLPGTTATFSANMLGEGPFSYQWQSGGTNLEAATNSSLVLTNVQLNQTGTYSVVASNAYGAATSLSAFLNVVPLLISRQLEDQVAVVGANLTLSVEVAGKQPIHYQWRLDDAKLEGATNASLVLNNVQLDQAGNYAVVVSNSYGAVASAGVRLSVVPLLITNHPHSQTVLAGASVMFNVAATGPLPFSYQWLLDGTNLNGATNDSLVLTSVQLNQAGVYSVVVSNAHGSVSSYEATLDVNPLSIASQPQSQTVLPETDVTFSVAAISQESLHYQWQWNGTNIESKTNSSLILPAVQMGQMGIYTVVLSNSYGEMSSADAVLSVVPLIIDSGPRDRTVLAGANISMSAKVIGKSPFACQWQFDGTNLLGATNSSLSLANIQLNQAGIYSVIVSNEYGQITSSSAELVVNPLAITRQPQSALVLAGASKSFNVAVSGQQPMSFQWQFNGENLDGANSPQLLLTNIQLNAIGAYAVTVSNRFGSVTSSQAQLNVFPIVITQPLRDRAILRGDVAILSVTAQSTQPIHYQWQFDGNNLIGETNYSLMLANFQDDQAGLYTVTLTNFLGSTKSSAQMSAVSVATWGGNAYGLAEVPASLSNILAVAGGGYHSLALQDDGRVAAWGQDVGQPELGASLNHVLAVACGTDHNLALLADGTVAAWGSNTFGQLAVPFGLSKVVAVAAGQQHSLALRSDGTVVGWGDNGYGQIDVPPNLGNVVAVAAGFDFSLALQSDGSVVAWGSGLVTNVPTDLTNVIAVAAGYDHGLALRFDGTVKAWGDDAHGATAVPYDLSNVVAVAAGYYHSLALRSDGTVAVWGNNDYDQANMPSGLTNVISIAAGGYHCLVLVGDGPPVTPVLAVQPELDDSGFSLQVPTQSGRVYELEYEDSLAKTNWVALPLVSGSGHIRTLEDPGIHVGNRFYRVRAW